MRMRTSIRKHCLIEKFSKIDVRYIIGNKANIQADHRSNNHYGNKHWVNIFNSNINVYWVLTIMCILYYVYYHESLFVRLG